MTHAPASAPAPASALPTDWLQQAHQAWQRWDMQALQALCEGARAAGPEHAADVQTWLGLADFMAERANALVHLDDAYQRHVDAARLPAAFAVVHRALVICLLDTSALDRVRDWLARWDTLSAHPACSPAADPAPQAAQPDRLWARLAPLAAVSIGGDGHALAERGAEELLADFRRPLQGWSPHEALMAAQVLIEHQHTVQRYENFDFLANAVQGPGLFEAAAPLLQSRWWYTYGYSQHLTGRGELAAQAWQRALQIAQVAGLPAAALQATLALARGLMSRGQLDQARAIIDAVQPQWGSGRTAQLIELLQLRARAELLQGKAVSALGLLDDAIRLAEAASLSQTEYSSCLSDQAQALLALGRTADAEQLTTRLAQEQLGRAGQIYRCQSRLIRSGRLWATDPEASRATLEEALRMAQQVRYTGFFGLLPATAAEHCARALRWGIEAPFVAEVISARALPAPPDAGLEWPWPLWLGLLGEFVMLRGGVRQTLTGKTPQKPLELLRFLGCQRKRCVSQALAMQSIWPEADEAAARKSLEVAVHRLRLLLGDASLLWVSDGQVGLDTTRVGSDVPLRAALVDRIETLAMTRAAAATAQQRQQGTAECLSLVERVVELTRGDLLAALPAHAWLLTQRRACRADTVRAALAAAGVLDQPSGDAERELLETALRIEPLAETLVGRLMAVYARAARRGDALRVYERYRSHLAELGAQPDRLLQRQWAELVSPAARPG